MSKKGMPPGFGDDDPTAPEKTVQEYARVDIRTSEVYAGRSDEKVPRPCIVLEALEPGRGVLLAGETSIRLVFREGVSITEASRLSAELHRYVEAITYMQFIT